MDICGHFYTCNRHFLSQILSFPPAVSLLLLRCTSTEHPCVFSPQSAFKSSFSLLNLTGKSHSTCALPNHNMLDPSVNTRPANRTTRHGKQIPFSLVFRSDTCLSLCCESVFNDSSVWLSCSKGALCCQ